jgi:hypothetical protein
MQHSSHAERDGLLIESLFVTIVGILKPGIPDVAHQACCATGNKGYDWSSAGKNCALLTARLMTEET